MMIRLSKTAMQKELGYALDRGEMSLHYQPQVDLRNGIITGNEALLRWNHPVWGYVSPDQFIPAAEKAGHVIPIGEWVLRTACRQNKKWMELGYPPMVMSVNLSARQFDRPDLFDMIADALADSGLEPRYLDLEITESMMMDADRAIRTLQKLKLLGVSISLDDFGKGYSSLSYLKRFPIDTLKIDRSFVQECTMDVHDATIVKTIVSMAHNLNLNVVAEGVESAEHLAFLQQHLCNQAQGYFFSRPLPAEELASKFEDIPGILAEHGIEPQQVHDIWVKEQLRLARHELEQTIRLQQGMTLKITRREGRFIHTFCDGELLYRLGQTPQQVVGKELADFLPAADAARKMVYYEMAWHGQENVSYESHLNGVWYLASLRPIRRGGKVVEIVASCVDITERKRSEEERIAAKEQLDSLMNSIGDPICIIDGKHAVLRVNPAFEDRFGWTFRELAGKTAPLEPKLWDVIHRESVKDYISSLVLKNGEQVAVRVTVSPIRDRKGNTTAYTSVIREWPEQRNGAMEEHAVR